MNNMVIPFPSPVLHPDNVERIVRDLKERPWRFARLGRKQLVPEGNKTESIYRWLRVGPPKTIHDMAYALQITYPATKAIINDLRARGARIVSIKKPRRERVYKMEGGPLTYAALKSRRRRRKR